MSKRFLFLGWIESLEREFETWVAVIYRYFSTDELNRATPRGACSLTLCKPAIHSAEWSVDLRGKTVASVARLFSDGAGRNTIIVEGVPGLASFCLRSPDGIEAYFKASTQIASLADGSVYGLSGYQQIPRPDVVEMDKFPDMHLVANVPAEGGTRYTAHLNPLIVELADDASWPLIKNPGRGRDSAVLRALRDSADTWLLVPLLDAAEACRASTLSILNQRLGAAPRSAYGLLTCGQAADGGTVPAAFDFAALDSMRGTFVFPADSRKWKWIPPDDFDKDNVAGIHAARTLDRLGIEILTDAVAQWDLVIPTQPPLAGGGLVISVNEGQTTFAALVDCRDQSQERHRDLDFATETLARLRACFGKSSHRFLNDEANQQFDVDFALASFVQEFVQPRSPVRASLPDLAKFGPANVDEATLAAHRKFELPYVLDLVRTFEDDRQLLDMLSRAHRAQPPQPIPYGSGWWYNYLRQLFLSDAASPPQLVPGKTNFLLGRAKLSDEALGESDGRWKPRAPLVPA
ncbi:hypothetical protein [Mesorhizobium caraganae]|uniref:hypothetical protein n=1 Tax=Mesorhizobium caraganae TaxID=483206 RepID=UPI0033396361